MSSSFAMRRYADWMASSTVRISCSRGTCFSALSWRRAPMKSRLMVASPSIVVCLCMGRQKKVVGVTHVLRRRPFDSGPEYTPGSVDRRSRSARSDLGSGWVAPLNVRLEKADELVHETVAAQGPVQPPIHEDRRDRILERTRQADTDVGVLRFPRPVDDAAHHRHRHLLDARVRHAPVRHALSDVRLDALRHLLEERGCGPAATRTGAHLGT